MLEKLTKVYPYNTKYYIIQYNENNFRILKNKYQKNKGWELSHNSLDMLLDCFFSNTHLSEEEQMLKQLESQRISLIRTKSRIRELALCNNFEYFGTITLNGYFCDRYELDDAQNSLKKILKKIKRNNKDFKYLIITEKHKDGAFHFHGLFSGIDLSLNDFGYFYNPELSKLGYNSFSLIKDYSKCCNYITKYITKDCVKNSHNQLFIRSKGLTFATKEEIKPLEIDWKFENDFVCIYDLDLNNINEYDKKLLLKITALNDRQEDL